MQKQLTEKLWSHLHLMHLLLPEVQAVGAIWLMQVADNDCSCCIAPEMTVQQVSLSFSCCVPNLQAKKGLLSACQEHLLSFLDMMFIPWLNGSACNPAILYLQ